MNGMAGLLKSKTNQLLERYLDHRLERTHIIPSFDRLMRLLSAKGLSPKTVIDIGVADGTPWLYQAAPSANFLLFDPTPHSLPHMNHWATQIRAEVFNIGLGETDCQMTMNVRQFHSSSSFLDGFSDPDLTSRTLVEVRRFDSLDLSIERPCLAKIDVQGAELGVIRGMGDRIYSVDCLIVEASLIPTMQGCPEFAEVMRLMAEREFCLFDITAFNRRPLDNALAQIDAVFVPRQSPLRLDHRWG